MIQFFISKGKFMTNKTKSINIFDYSKKISILQIILTILFFTFMACIWALLALAYRNEFISQTTVIIILMFFFWLIIVPLSVLFITMYFKNFTHCSWQLLNTEDNEKKIIIKRIMWFPLIFSFYYKNYAKTNVFKTT